MRTRSGPRNLPISCWVLALLGMSLSNGFPSSPSSGSSLEIPVIGPLLNVPKPLIIGESMWLNPPTPLQWKTIEFSVEAQKQSLQPSLQRNNQSTQENIIPGLDAASDPRSDSHAISTDNRMATIDQSPLVAVLHKGGRDVATIAAIVGIVTSEGRIDTTSAESFRESLAMAKQSPYYNDHSRVRLVGIGRARLTKFVLHDNNQSHEETTQALNEEELLNYVDDNDITVPEPLLLAQMTLLLDSNEHGKPSSSVHALNRMSSLTSRIRWLHQDRQKIIRWLQAAQAQLEMAMEEWDDYDGIGTIFHQETNTASTLPQYHAKTNDSVDMDMTPNIFQQEFDGSRPKDAMTTSLPLSSAALKCMKMDNFGLGTTPTVYADLTAMAEVLVERLIPFYSPTRTDTEEFTYEAFSWVALESLKLYLTHVDIMEALQSTNTCERLEMLYNAMTNHKRDLSELARAKTQELRECGEECIGLF